MHSPNSRLWTQPTSTSAVWQGPKTHPHHHYQRSPTPQTTLHGPNPRSNLRQFSIPCHIKPRQLLGSIICSYLALFLAPVSKLFRLKKFLIFSLKEPALKKYIIFSQKKLFQFPRNAIFLYFLKKVFLIFREMYIQNPDIIRTGSIFRNLVYSEPEAYSEQCQTYRMERLAKVLTQCTFQPKLEKLKKIL